MKVKFILSLFVGSFLLLAANRQPAPAYFEKLSDYQLFIGKLAEMNAAADVLPYELNTPLFSDHAHKARFIKLPAGSQMNYREKTVFDFPQGTVIAKTFFYNLDERKPEKGRNLLETRILKKEADGWVALPYVWNDAQTEAYLDVAGAEREVKWRNQAGKKLQLTYRVPNMNQCKSCHAVGQELLPIGPTARQLNRPENGAHQLTVWAEQGHLSGLPDPSALPTGIVWNDPTTGTLDQRARTYLDINCAHCHQREGSANTSGLFLDFGQTDAAALGIGKAPIAAGRGSGGRPFSIVPGHPEKSIFIYRMNSTDPGVMMPELGRQLIDEEGVALIEAWIAEMAP